MSGVGDAGGYDLTGWVAWLKHRGPAGCSVGCQAGLNGWLLSMDNQETARLSVQTGDLCLHNEKSANVFCGGVPHVTWKTSTLNQ